MQRRAHAARLGRALSHLKELRNNTASDPAVPSLPGPQGASGAHARTSHPPPASTGTKRAGRKARDRIQEVQHHPAMTSLRCQLPRSSSGERFWLPSPLPFCGLAAAGFHVVTGVTTERARRGKEGSGRAGSPCAQRGPTQPPLRVEPSCHPPSFLCSREQNQTHRNQKNSLGKICQPQTFPQASGFQ